MIAIAFHLSLSSLKVSVEDKCLIVCCILIYLGFIWHGDFEEREESVHFSHGLHMDMSFLFLLLDFGYLQVLINVFASSSSAFIPWVMTFSPYEAATLGSRVSCYRQAVCKTLAGACRLPAPTGTLNCAAVVVQWFLRITVKKSVNMINFNHCNALLTM